MVLTPAQYRIEIPLVTPVPFPPRRPAATPVSAAQAGLSSPQESAPTGIGWQEALGAAAAAAMGIVTTYGIWKAPPAPPGTVSGASQWAGSSGLRPAAGGGSLASPLAGTGASLRPSPGGSAPQAGTGAQATRAVSGPSDAWGSEGSAFAAPTAEERRRGEGWTNGGVLGATPSRLSPQTACGVRRQEAPPPSVTWQGDLSSVAGARRMSTAAAEPFVPTNGVRRQEAPPPNARRRTCSRGRRGSPAVGGPIQDRSQRRLRQPRLHPLRLPLLPPAPAPRQGRPRLRAIAGGRAGHQMAGSRIRRKSPRPQRRLRRRQPRLRPLSRSPPLDPATRRWPAVGCRAPWGPAPRRRGARTRT